MARQAVGIVLAVLVKGVGTGAKAAVEHSVHRASETGSNATAGKAGVVTG